MSDDTRERTRNATQFAEHYEAATGILLWALAEPSGETFAYAHGEAMRAHGSAHELTEQSLALQLAHGIVTAALSHGYRLRVPSRSDRMQPSNPQFGQWR